MPTVPRSTQRAGWSLPIRIEQLENDLDSLEDAMGRLETKIDKMNGRLWGFTIALFSATLTIAISVALAVR